MCGYFPDWSFFTVNFHLFWAFCYLKYSLFTDRGIRILIRVSHITPFFELSYTLLTTHALGLDEVTKKFQHYRQ